METRIRDKPKAHISGIQMEQIAAASAIALAESTAFFAVELNASSEANLKLPSFHRSH